MKQIYWLIKNKHIELIMSYINVISYIPETKINQFAKLSNIDHTDDNLIKIYSNYQYSISFSEYL